MKTVSELRKLPRVLFMHVPVGATILFNGCICIKLDEKHVKFITGITGELVDYSKRYNKRYARTTQSHIGGTVCRIVSLPKKEKKETPASLIERADSLISQAKAALIKSPLVIEDLHTANCALSDALSRIERSSK